ncbi:hypothetical protein GSUET_28450 [Geobacter sulfurreducens subsp. ethanolicus]|uniref:hypothetical protein n=1 Tax=Geobacter sulfurreducens TaxID=35554 RepID=UPI00257470CF|nr:hypothetical protein [Geobacter sulfurreducens]BEH11233.1 hypothetical protein GSUET_28450 [Geobacter sulfurreducens subsp. ethanolicus]
MLFTKAVAGDYSGDVGIKTKVMWSGISADKFQSLTFIKAKTEYKPEQIIRVVHLSEEKTKSFLGSAVTGIAGGLLLGGAGLLAGALVGGKKTLARIGVEFSDGCKVILEQEPDNAQLKCFLMYAKEAGVLEQDLGF